MNCIKLIPAIISLFLMAAHFYRAGILPMAVIIATTPLLLLVPKPWTVMIIRTLLFIGGIEWIITLVQLISVRQSTGMPWLRLSLILGLVAMVALGSIFLFRVKSLKKRYHLNA